MKAGEKVEVENVNHPGRTSRVDAARYRSLRATFARVMPTKAPGLNQAEMIAALKEEADPEHFPNGEKVAWWAKTVQLDLEAKGLLAREKGRPLRWHRTGDL